MYYDRYIRSNLLTLYCSNVSNMVSSVVTSMSHGIIIVYMKVVMHRSYVGET